KAFGCGRITQMRIAKRVLLVVVVLVVLSVATLLYLFSGGKLEGPGEITKVRLPDEVVATREQQQREAAQRLAPGGEAPGTEKQILFGDLHVHTTYSADAFMMSLPLLHGEGAHPPGDACDFARYCSALDFWSINDHAEAISPQHWKDTKEAIRQCNAVA